MQIEDVFSDLPTLETDRTILRKLRSEDEEDIFHYGSDEEVSRYTAWPTHQTMEDTRLYLMRVLHKYCQHAVALGNRGQRNRKGHWNLRIYGLGCPTC